MKAAVLEVENGTIVVDQDPASANVGKFGEPHKELKTEVSFRQRTPDKGHYEDYQDYG